MSIFKNFLKYKKGGFVEQKESQNPLEKPLAYDKSYIMNHNRAVLEDGRLYDTSKSEKVFTNPDVEHICFGSKRCRVYFLSPNGRWFSADGNIECATGKITDVGAYRIQVTKIITTYKNLRIEQEVTVKTLIGKNDYELYKKYFGEAEEA